MKNHAPKRRKRIARPARDLKELIADLTDLARCTESLGMNKVTLCLQYAYWEALCEYAAAGGKEQS